MNIAGTLKEWVNKEQQVTVYEVEHISVGVLSRYRLGDQEPYRVITDSGRWCVFSLSSVDCVDVDKRDIYILGYLKETIEK